MKIVALDFETYYDRDYSLSKMTTDSYVHDRRFKVHMMSMRDAVGGYHCFPPHLIPHVLGKIDWPNTAILCQNTAFDGYILKAHYRTPDPKLWLDTLSMARPILGNNSRHSLAALAQYYGLPPKGDEVVRMLGKWELTPQEYQAGAEYCIQDTRLCWEIFERLRQGFPAKELRVIDLTLRMFLNPTLRLDQGMLEQYLAEVIQGKEDALAQCGLDSRDALMSNDQFAELLEALGVEPPMKISKTTGLPTLAMAKSDPAFKELLDHDDPRVASLVAARLGVKSTQEETRTERYLTVARDNRPWPVLLNYYGAMTTGRHSGGNKQNAQNLKRGGTLRNSVMAPPGHKIVVVDSSQIEVRVNATVAGEQALIDGFARKEDIYSMFATDVYQRAITKADKLERHVGKGAILGLGYGMGHPKFQLSMKTGTPPVLMELDQCEHIVKLYRSRFPAIPALWRMLNRAIQCVYEGIERDFGYFSTTPEGLRLVSNGFLIRYPHLRPDGAGGWTYTQKGKPSKLYGAKAVENLIQALARCVVTDQMIECCRREYVDELGHQLSLFTHDELVFVAPEETADDVLKLVLEKMHTPPAWMPSLPVAAEGDIGVRYGEAK